LHAEFPYLREILVFLAAAGLVMPVARRFAISPVLGFLCIGVLLGPYGLGRLIGELPWIGYIVVSDLEGVQQIGELGVIFLLFSIGLEMSLSQLWGMRRTVFGLGSAQILVSAAAIAGVATMLGLDTATAILLGLCLALSSTAIVMQLLSEKLRLGSQPGRTAFGILLMQDLAVVPILFYVGFLGTQSSDGALWAEVLLTLAQALAVILAIFLVGRLVVRPILRFAGSNGSREMFMASVLFLILGTSALTAGAGLSMALGAFLAGLLFSATEYRYQVNSDIEPFKGLLLALFFISVGMRLDLVELWDTIGWVALAAFALVAAKAAILFILALAFRRPLAIAAEVAVLLGEGGEFALVAVTSALALAVIAPDVAQFVISVVVVTMIATPGLEAAGRRLGNFLVTRRVDDEPALPEDEASESIVIGGFGRVGRILGKILEDQRIRYIAIDASPEIVEDAKRAGLPIFYGDASSPELLRSIGIGKAAAFVTTMDDPGAAEKVVSAVHGTWPQVPIYARARDPAQARDLRRLGAFDAVPETTEASLQLSESVLFGFGVPEEVARSVVDQERESLCFDIAGRERRGGTGDKE
jgi:monovalent cation:proton antiporter-2 (CPA2) family protein